jgi:hypothetical protein
LVIGSNSFFSRQLYNVNDYKEKLGGIVYDLKPGVV